MSHATDSFESPRVSETPALSRSHTLAVLGIALALRLLVLWISVTKHPPQWFFTRGIEMGLLAQSLLSGHGLSSPFGGSTGPTAFIAPVYPILVAFVFKLFGQFTTASELVILSAQIALNLLTVWLIMHIARQLFSQTAATLAGLIWACSLPLVWMPTIFWETSLSSCLLIGLFALVLQYRRKSQLNAFHWMFLGAYCGFAALVNPALLLSVVAVALWLAFTTRKTTFWRPLLAAIAFIIVFSAWPLRNARAFHKFIPLRTTVGFELWMGNREGASGFLEESLFPMFNRTERDDYKTRGEVGYSQHKSELAKTYIQAHPAEFLRLTTIRTKRFWTGTGTRNGSPLFAIHATVTTFLGAIGLFFLLRSRRFDQAILFILPLLLFPLPYLITHAEFRYRIIIDPLLTIFAAYAVVELCKSFSSRHSLTPAPAPTPSPTANETIAWSPSR